MQFRRWYDEAVADGVRQPEAMTLATVAADGAADARTVLLRGLDQRGFAFYTNLESAKAQQMREDRRVALVFHWREVERQVRVRGSVTVLDRDEATQYWESRPRGSPDERVGVAAERCGGRRHARGESRRGRSPIRRRRPAVTPVLGWIRGGRGRAGVLAGTGRSVPRSSALPPRRRCVAPRPARAVTPLAGVALVCAILFALGNWWAVARGDKRLEFVCKPATMVALIVVAVVLDPAGGQGDRRVWFVVALVFSLAGDVFLMLPRDAFISGLAAFLLAHVCYVVGFWTDPPGAAAMVVATVVVVIAVAPIAVRILRALAPQREMRGPVSAYMLVIAAMVASAVASGNVVAAVGAVAFAGSDSLIAWNRFVRPLAGAGVVIMVTYHLGQILLTLSLLAA